MSPPSLGPSETGAGALSRALARSEAKWSWSVVSDCQTPELCPLWPWVGPANTGVGLCLLSGGHLAAQPRVTSLGLCSAELLQRQKQFGGGMKNMSEFCLSFPAFVATSEISC